ncbi:MAG: nuclear transport factor 2 family protein [Alphaproteobacteria bacterium]|nr:nuclear transport factor 2 family protein [Alphaproteobacteria bacterium]
MVESSGVTLALVEEIVAAFNRKDVDAILAYFADDGEFYLAAGPEPWGQVFKGREAIGAALRDRFAAIPDLQWVDGRNWIMGDKALSEWRVQGTLENGERIDCLGCDLWEFRDGKVLKKDTYYKRVTG